MRIAIVEDITSEREHLKAELDVQLARLSLNAVTFEYASGSDFLAAAGKERFDLVFLDIYMGNETEWIRRGLCAALTRTVCLYLPPPPPTMPLRAFASGHSTIW